MKDFTEEDFDDLPFCGLECNDQDLEAKEKLLALSAKDTCWLCDTLLIRLSSWKSACPKCGMLVSYS